MSMLPPKGQDAVGEGVPSRRALPRRAFLRGTLAAGIAPWIIPASALGRNGTTAPSNRVVVAAIGLGFAWPMFL